MAFSAGSSENAVPEPGWTLATWPRISRSGIGVDRERHRLAGPHAVELRLLEVGRHPDFVGHEHRQAVPACGELAGGGAGVDDTPRLGGRHGRVGEVELRLVALRLRLREAGRRRCLRCAFSDSICRFASLEASPARSEVRPAADQLRGDCWAF